MLVSILIVSFNTRRLTTACLDSIYDQFHDESQAEIIVVDNASTDGSGGVIEQEFPKVRLIQSQENLGFARANNLAAGCARGDYLLLLNPDTVILNHAIDRLLDFAHKDGGCKIYGGRTLFSDRSLNLASCWKEPSLWSLFCVASGLSKIRPHSNWFNPDYMPSWRRDSVSEVDIISGCFFMISKVNWERLGGFDPAFHMYGEEFDFCLRAKKLGIQCKITPDAEIIHYGGASERARADKMCRLFETKTMLFRKHWHPIRAYLGCQLLKLWAVTRLVVVVPLDLIQRRNDRTKTWCSIWRRRRQWLARV